MTTTEELNKALSDGKAGAFAVEVPKTETRGADIFRVSWVGRVDIIALMNSLRAYFGDRVLEVQQLTDMKTSDGKPCAAHEIQISHRKSTTPASPARIDERMILHYGRSLDRWTFFIVVNMFLFELAKAYFGKPYGIEAIVANPMVYAGHAIGSLLVFIIAARVFGHSTTRMRRIFGAVLLGCGSLCLLVAFLTRECLPPFAAYWSACVQPNSSETPMYHLWDANSTRVDKVVFIVSIACIQLAILLFSNRVKFPKSGGGGGEHEKSS